MSEEPVEAEKLTGDALTIAFLKANLAELRTGGIVTVALTNPNVMSYMEHWEGRAEKAEARLSEAVKVLRVVSDTSHRARDRKHYRVPIAPMVLVDRFLATLGEENGH